MNLDVQPKETKGMVNDDQTLIMRKTFPYHQTEVFDAWIQPESIRLWFFPREGWTIGLVRMDLRVGGHYHIEMSSATGELFTVEGTYLVVEPSQALSFTWRWPDEPAMGETRVDLTFIDNETSTELVLVHSLFPTKEARADHEWGWEGCFKHLEASLR